MVLMMVRLEAGPYEWRPLKGYTLHVEDKGSLRCSNEIWKTMLGSQKLNQKLAERQPKMRVNLIFLMGMMKRLVAGDDDDNE
jgi:hypothetical protein